jgi:two-component system LytT family sensor kinase
MKTATKFRVSQFWALQSIAWPAYGLVSFGGALPYVGAVPHLDSVSSLIANRIAFVAVGMSCGVLLRIVYRRERRRPTSLVRTVILIVFPSFFYGLAATAASNAARHAAGGMYMRGWAIFGGAISASAIFLAWSACYWGARAHLDIQRERQNALSANAKAHEAQLAALRGQLNPHFLFNSLNSIQALITEEPSRAQFAVEKLASLLRYSLRQTGGGEASVLEELEVINQYLAIEKIRFEEKLVVETEIEPGAQRFMVPGFLFHPLVENAIKYGMQTSSMPLKRRIYAAMIGNLLCFEIANTGSWKESGHGQNSGLGFGLQLVRERLEQAYPKCHRFARTSENGWVTQRIEIQHIAGRPAHALSRSAGG